MEEKINKLYKLVIIILVIGSINLLFNVASLFKVKDSNVEESTETTETASNYDVSSFKTLDAKGVVDLFSDKKNTYVVYFGRSTCSACVNFLPTLKTMQNKYNYITQYLDITTVDAQSDDYNKLMEKLSAKVKLTVNGTTSEQSFSEYYGYTPMTFIIKNGKFVDGIVGAYSESKFEEFLNNNGIK